MIFPAMRGKNGGYINLNESAEKHDLWQKRPKNLERSPFLDPATCQQMVAEYHAERGLVYSFGGWLEDRSLVWGGSYMEEGQKFIHLGYDFNASVGTPVAVNRECELIQIDDDTPEEHGWGTRLIVRLIDEPMFLIYAHVKLRLSHGQKKPGTILHPGCVFAEIAPSDCNGGWYSHVHVQAMALEAYQEFQKNPASLDGYGKKSDIAKLARWHPDPMRFIAID